MQISLSCENAPCRPTRRDSSTRNVSWNLVNCCTAIRTRVSAAADRPARRRGSAHAKYSVSHHAVIKPFLLFGLAAEYRSRRCMWLTVVQRPSDVYDTHRRTKLTAPETNSRSRDMVGAHQNLNGSRYLTTPLSGMVCHLWAIALATFNLSTKFDVCNSTHYEDMKGDIRCRKWSGLG